MPFLVFATSMLLGDSRWYPAPGNIAVGLGALLAALIYCYCVAFATEFRTDRLREFLERRLKMQPTPPILPSNPLSESGVPGPG